MRRNMNRYQQAAVTIIGLLMVVTICIGGLGTGNRPLQAEAQKEKVYAIGKDGMKKNVSLSLIENMKKYLSYDLGYGYNSALERQNIFANGFFLELASSSFGQMLAEKYFHLVKDDFAEAIARNRRVPMYAHQSGLFDVEKQMESYAKDFYSLYTKVKDHKRELDSTLLVDCIKLAHDQKTFPPTTMKMFAQFFLSQSGVNVGYELEKANLALFKARNNEDLLGDQYLELFSQAVIQGSLYAQDQGYSTTDEEAKAFMMEKSTEFVKSNFANRVEKKEELGRIHSHLSASIGIEQKDLINVVTSLLTFEKMLQKVDSTVVVDKLAIENLHKKDIEQIDALVIVDTKNMEVKTAEDALELDLYFSSIGKKEEFLSVCSDKELYSVEEIEKRAPFLLTKNYKINLTAITLDEVKELLPLKKVWDYQLTKEGWEKIKKKFLLAEVKEEDLCNFYEKMDEKKAQEVENFVRGKIVEADATIVAGYLTNKKGEDVVFSYNTISSSELFEDGFDEQRLFTVLENKEGKEQLSCYSQDNKKFYRIIVEAAAEKSKVLTFEEAKERNVLSKALEEKLTEMNGGKKVPKGKNREKLIAQLLIKEAKSDYDKIAKAFDEKKQYADHSMKRLLSWKEKKGIVKSSLLSQFNVVEKREVITRNHPNKALAQEKFFIAEKGTMSKLEDSADGPFFLMVEDIKVDEGLLKKHIKVSHRELADEARKELYKKLIAHIQDNELVEETRFKKEG